jgi:hypothetical protein
MSTDAEQRSKIWPGVALWLGAIASGVIALWSSRAYYENRFNVGWGDAGANQYQRILWWSIAVSVVVFLFLVIALMICSKKLCVTLIPAAALCGIAMAMSRWTRFDDAGLVLIPGFYLAVLLFGVHADFSLGLQLGWFFGISTAIYTAVGMVALSLLWKNQGD